MSAGIYIHIPFCKQACHYCNFHFSTQVQSKENFINALLQEIEIRKGELKSVSIESIYFGGGTPSLLNAEEIALILEKIYKSFSLENSPEITFEANPDDLSKIYLKQLKASGINRLSIGVQSFNDEHLQFMNRAHNANEVEKCLSDAKEEGFKSINMDLIYGLPDLSNQEWTETLRKVKKLPVDHLSCYALTVEPQTALDYFIQNKKVKAPDDELTSEHFSILQKFCLKEDWDHYEISNIALKKNSRAKHNSNYWNRKAYLGFGPSAHSFDGYKTRRWNIANNSLYVKKIKNHENFWQEERLSNQDIFNEILMTGLRKTEGIAIDQTISLLNRKDKLNFLNEAKSLAKQGLINFGNDRIQLTNESRFLADHVISQLFLVND